MASVITNRAQLAVDYARQQIGKPYVWGAVGPGAYDCSGLVMAAYAQVGITLPRTTFLQIASGTEVKRADLAIGDLIFPDPGHVQIYSGDGKIVEAAESGIPIREVTIWGFWRARRIIPANSVYHRGINGPWKAGELKPPLPNATHNALIQWEIVHTPAWKNDPNRLTQRTHLQQTSDADLISAYNDLTQGQNVQAGDPGQVTTGSAGLNDTLNQVGNTLSGLTKALTFLADPGNWRRLALFIAGMALIIMALTGLQNVKTLGKTGASVVKGLL